MKWLLDTASLNEVREYLPLYPVAGVTTNPTLLRRVMPVAYAEHLKALRALCGELALHVQVGGSTPEEMLSRADYLRDTVGEGLYLKVPVTPEGLKTILTLKKQGARVTATAVYSSIQGMLAVSAGADYSEMCDLALRLVPDAEELMNVDGGGSALLAITFGNRLVEYSWPSSSPGTLPGMARPVNSLFQIQL